MSSSNMSGGNCSAGVSPANRKSSHGRCRRGRLRYRFLAAIKAHYFLIIFPVSRSCIVEGRRRAPIGPGITSTRLPNRRRHSAAVLAGLPPLRLALVDTSAIFAARHKPAAPRWAVTRTATESCAPRRLVGQSREAGTSQVCGPGQRERMRFASSGVRSARKGRNCRGCAAIRISPLEGLRFFSFSTRLTACGFIGSQPSP
jgi:hypothetical protein